MSLSFHCLYVLVLAIVDYCRSFFSFFTSFWNRRAEKPPDIEHGPLRVTLPQPIPALASPTLNNGEIRLFNCCRESCSPWVLGYFDTGMNHEATEEPAKDESDSPQAPSSSTSQVEVSGEHSGIQFTTMRGE